MLTTAALELGLFLYATKNARKYNRLLLFNSYLCLKSCISVLSPCRRVCHKFSRIQSRTG